MLTHKWRASLKNFCRLSLTHSVIPSSIIGHIFACVCEVQLLLFVKFLNVFGQLILEVTNTSGMAKVLANGFNLTRTFFFQTKYSVSNKIVGQLFVCLSVALSAQLSHLGIVFYLLGSLFFNVAFDV